MRVLTLFSGTGSITRALTHFSNAEEVTLDLNEPADIMEDILTWDPTIFAPGAFDIVWASPECTQYSRARTTAKTPRDLEHADGMVNKTLQVIDYLQPKVWFIENPSSGLLKRRNMMLLRPYFDVDYCMYDAIVRKRTAIWSNIPLSLHTCTETNRCPLFVNGRHAFYFQDTPSGKQRAAIPVALLVSIFTQALDHL